jgi:hypothetical protein
MTTTVVASLNGTSRTGDPGPGDAERATRPELDAPKAGVLAECDALDTKAGKLRRKS